jgi:1-acyl-sn-glycerol-3-phosphate acyltransferase
MPAFFLKLFEFFQTRKRLLFAVLILLTAILTFFASKIRLSEDIADFIPKDKQVKNIGDVFEQIKTNDKLIVILSTTDSSEASVEKMISQADEVANDIKEQMFPGKVKEINYKISGDMMQDTYDLFWRNLPYFLDDNDYDHIAKMIAPANVDTVLSHNYKMLISPAGFVLKKYLVRDPFSITGLAAGKLGLTSIGNNYLMHKDRIFSKDKKNLMMFLSTTHPASESSINSEMIASLEKIIANIKDKNPGSRVKIQYYGATAVAVGNANQLKKDSMMTMALAIVILFVFLGIFFKNIRTIFFLLLPVLFGGIFSLAVIYFLKSEISTIAIGASSIILGIAINYSIHFYAHYRHEKSLRQVIKDLAMPMTIGSTTTIGAFLGLLMVKSTVLNDFGLLSALVLVGSVLFTLIFLPYFVKKPKKDQPVLHVKATFIDRLSAYHFERNPYILIGIVVLTIFFLFKATNIGFESDLTKMGYMSAKLQQAEQTLNNISDSSLRPIYLVSHGANANEALQNSEVLNQKVNDLQKRHLINQVSTVTNVLLSAETQKCKIEKWNAFWAKTDKDKEKFKQHLTEEGRKYNFKPEAFNEFFGIIDAKYNGISNSDLEYLKQHFVGDLISHKANNNFVITSLKINPKYRDEVVSYFPENDITTVIDRQYLTSKYAGIINSDFNTILIISSLLVFCFLLMMYGRIELALISFIPMFVSWFWILGIMSLLGIQFNIVSIIISAFIFGLGDDYSIFIMDGLLQGYKKGSKLLDSYKTAVFLSAFTTLVGVGVLIFAKHPALKSIAILTIIGMFSVVFLSFTVAPALFNLLVYKKGKFRKFPVTAYGFLYAVVCYSWFLTGCVITAFLGLTIYKILPVSRKKRQKLYHHTLRFVCRSTMYLMYFTRKQVINLTPETYKKPAVIIVNHQSIIDIPLLLMFSPKVIMITNDAFYYSKFIGIIVKLGGFLPASAGFDFIGDKLASAVADGYSILVFPEGTRRNDGKIHRFHKGAFYLAEKLKLDIQPMVTQGTGNYIAKGELMGRKSLITVKFLERIAYGDPRWGADYSERAKTVQQYFRKEYQQLLDEFYNTPKLLNDIIIRNFIYKGPVVEWYTRIKLAIEQKNYRVYNDLIPRDARILDVGCGYGYLAMMLGMLSPDRRITAVDYDEEKIEVARHCMSKPANVDFYHKDITAYEMEPQDVFVLSDVLHYLPEAKQWALLEKCISRLNLGGKILIRDGNADLQHEHKRTRLTEFLSTHIGFNKTDNMKLYFLSAKRLEEVCNGLGVKMSILDKGNVTSNMIFLLER